MSPNPFAQQPLALNLILFACAAALVWVAGTRLSHYADAISDRKRIGKALMGLVFLAAATSLPELVTTISAAIAGNAALVLNNLFGGITLQTAILVFADMAAAGAALTFYPRKATSALEGSVLILLLALLLGVAVLGDRNLAGNIGMGALFLTVAYVLAIALLRTYDKNSGWHPVEVPEEKTSIAAPSPKELDRLPLPRLYWLFAGASAIILLAGIMLVLLSETLADQTGLGSSFVGVTLLAAATSLPELSTTIAAVRIGAFTMAISNIFGSNLILLALLFPADVFYRKGVILADVDRSAVFALISGIAVTGVYVIGLLVRHRRPVLGMGLDSLVVLALYLASLVVFYQLR